MSHSQPDSKIPCAHVQCSGGYVYLQHTFDYVLFIIYVTLPLDSQQYLLDPLVVYVARSFTHILTTEIMHAKLSKVFITSEFERI